MSFSQNILCDLARSSQTGIDTFDCQAFRPSLSAVNDDHHSDVPSYQINNDNSLSTPQQQWLKAYAVQQLKQSSTSIHFKLKYHVCLVTKQRVQIFPDPQQHVKWFTHNFQKIESQVKETLIQLLWLDIDHIHFTIESTPDYAVYNIVTDIINQLEICLHQYLPNTHEYNGLWATDFFVESIG